MRLSLDLPPPWKPAGRDRAVLAGEGPLLTLIVGALILRPDEPRAWIEQTMNADLPPSQHARIGISVERETRAGWPMRLVAASVVEGDTVVAARLGAFYSFLEHAAVALGEVAAAALAEPQRAELVGVFDAGRPDWSGEPACLHDLWDLEPPRPRPPRAPGRVSGVAGAELTAALEQASTAVAAAAPPAAAARLARGRLLLEAGRAEDALADLRAAGAADPAAALPGYLAGVALGQLGRHAEAAAAWRAVVGYAPTMVDAHYNLAQALMTLDRPDEALASFRAAGALDPDDLIILRKQVQCLHALGRDGEAEAARDELRHRTLTSADPRDQRVTDVVFDQFAVAGFRVHAVETLRPRDPAFHVVIAFHAVDAADRPLPASVVIETSDHARRAGTPVVLGVVHEGRYRAVGTSARMPAYAALKQTASELLAAALAPKT